MPVLLAVLFTALAAAGELHIKPDGAALQTAIAQAKPGDHVILAAGIYHGNFRIDKPLTLQGEPGAVLDGDGHGDVLRVRAPDVVLKGLVIRDSGNNLTDMNAGVFVEKSAARLRVEDNELARNAFGIWLDATPDVRIYRNRVHGRVGVRSQDRGNGIHLFNVGGADVVGNEVWEVRDGIYIGVSNYNTLRGNSLHDLRYGIHYMFSNHNKIIGNRTRATRTGYALMQSKYLTVTGNRSEHDENYGILMNYITNSTIADNVVLDVQRGAATGGIDSHSIAGTEGKAVFIYNSLFNKIYGNVFEGSEIGIHLTAGSEDNAIYGNSFINNHTQVKYVASRPQEWSKDKRGNYWSDYVGWDLNADGIGDRIYEPNDAVDKLLWKYPLARMLMNSPAVETLRWVQVQFPVLRPQGVKDSFPLMKAPVTAGDHA